MTFNKKKFTKPRIYRAVKNHPGISRLFIWNNDFQQYVEPMRGKRFLASRYVIRNGRRDREKIFFSTLEEARNWQAGISKKKEDVSGREKQYLFCDLVEDFRKKQYPFLREGTKLIYENRMKHLDFLMSYPVEEISPKTLDDWISWLNSPSRKELYQHSRVSFKKEYACLRAILSWYIQNNDDAKLIMPFKARHKKTLLKRSTAQSPPIYLTEEEYEKWLSTLKALFPDMYPIALFQKEQVKRIHEVCGMKWKHLDLKARTYRLCESVEWLRVKGAKPKLKQGTKTIEAGNFEVLQLRQNVVDLLAELQKSQSCDLIFHNKGKLWGYREIQHRYDRAFKKAKLPYTGTHILRHTGATHFLNEMEDELTLTELGGWKSTKQARHYGQMLGLTVRKVLDEADKKRQEGA